MKNIVITGVTRGLGRAMAESFAKLGHRVAGCGRSSAELATLAKTVSGDFQQADVANDEQIEKWSAHVLKHVGVPDLLINNAAVINANAPLWKVSADEFSRVIDINIKGVTNVIRHFVPPMIEKSSGVIVNFSSGWGRSTDAEVAPYCATKWAIEGLTQALSQELPSGMAAVALNPGVIDTDMLRSCFGGSASSYPSPEQWAKKAAPFLLGLSAKDNGQPLTAPS